MLSAFYRFRQWKYPKEFRIVSNSKELWNELVISSIIQIFSELILLETDERQEKSPDLLKEINSEFLITLCNGHFRIKRNIELLMGENLKRKEVRRIWRTLERLDNYFHEIGLQYIDLTNEPYDPGRSDFEPLGEPEEVNGITEKTILQCERPAIWFQGKLIQPAKGIVARPA